MRSIESIISTFNSISLSQLDQVKLQNRVDSKYILTEDKLMDILEEIKEEQLILEIDHVRIFNYQTDYFDTDDYQFYRDHHNGAINRIKVRCRNYVESNFCMFEIKRKLFGTRTDKFRTKINTLPDQLNNDQYDLIQYKRLKQKPLIKTLSNQFKRITLTNKDFSERITIDLGIQFLFKTLQKDLPKLVVIEVKQMKLNYVSNTILILKKHKVHKSSFSKYAIGIALLNQNLKSNAFKPILIQIEKLLKPYAKYRKATQST
ncbi:MAG: polyphosphate polymerase domain-containing protein [Chitinophagaceae bacterium]